MSYSGYYVNGYKFHTKMYGSGKATMNSGVCIKGSNYSASECDYYGQLIEVVQLEYPALPIKRTVLFKCEWFDPTSNTGTKVHPQYKLVEVNKKRRLKGYEPFVMAVQACQVNFIAYPSVRRERSDWLAVCKIKPMARFQIPQATSSSQLFDVSPAFQEDDIDIHYIDIENDESVNLVDATGAYIDIEEDNEEEEPELESQSHDDDEETEEDEWDSNDHDSD